ncbi:unannotated protein [freshwater metagenome]|uniref:Unannotated protein n=1 Tax=freshwater metagenome TaxID=449393 RepID=A0A6J6A0A7_9ZZZZ
MPAHETNPRSVGRAFSMAARASRPPAPNSQTRVGVTKNAAAGSLAVAITE